MKIDNNILAISNVMFRERHNWKYVTEDQKNEFAFIFNRFFSKKFPDKSLFLNIKDHDKSVIMDMWFYFMGNENYPKWFWNKSSITLDRELSDKDFKLLMIKLNLNKEEDLIYLINNNFDFIKEELDWYKKKEKNGNK